MVSVLFSAEHSGGENKVCPRPKNELTPFSPPVFFRILATAFCVLLVPGCSSKPPPAPQAGQANRPAEDTLESITEALGKGTDFETYRGALQQLNLFLGRHEEEVQRSFTKEEEDFLVSSVGLDKSELAEVASKTFTPLDAHQLDLGFLLHDAIRSLKLDEVSPLEQAAEAFAWVIRQIRLNERKGEVLPPLFVLRRGWGTAQERALAFVEMLDQLGIDGCMIAIPEKVQEQTALRYWVAGALVGMDIYLFDTRLGLPLPGPGGKGIATLAQVRGQPEVLTALTVDPKLAYDVTPDKTKEAEVHVAYTLSSLSPRMRHLQEILAANLKIKFSVDLLARYRRFGAACKESAAGCPVRAWNQPGDHDTPIRVLRRFLPKAEGGTDTQHRREQAIQQLIPWQFLPQQIRELPPVIGQELQPGFSVPFVSFALDSRGPRQLVLRGRFEEATNRLVEALRELRRQKDVLRTQKNLEEDVQAWRAKAVQAYAALLGAERLAADPKAGGQAGPALAHAKERVNALWKESGKIKFLVQASAAEPLSGEVIYLQALCKLEQAERWQSKHDRSARAGKDLSPADLQALRSAWIEDRSWWATYLEENANSPSGPTARLHQARALNALGDREAAIAMLENLDGSMAALEKIAHLYLAEQLKGSNPTKSLGP